MTGRRRRRRRKLLDDLKERRGYNKFWKSHNSMVYKPISLTAQSKAWVFGRCVSGIAGPNPARCMDIFSCVCCVCCQVEASATSRSLVQRSPTECSV